MMLTGFDAPPLHTLYLDRPLKSALLMQTLARVNRKFRQKESGLLEAYAPLIDNLQAAIAEFTKSSSDEDEKVIGQNIEAALVIVRGFVDKLNALAGEEWRELEAAGQQQRLPPGSIRPFYRVDHALTSDVARTTDPEPR